MAVGGGLVMSISQHGLYINNNRVCMMCNRVIIRIKTFQGKKTLWKVLVLSLFFFSFVNLCPASPVLLEEGKSHFSIGLHLEILEDPEGELTISDVISEDFNLKFIQSTTPTPSFGFSNSAYWVRFELVNPYMQSRSLFLESDWSHHDLINFYAFDGKKKIKKKLGIYCHMIKEK